MVHVQVREEDVVDLRDGYLVTNDVSHTDGAEIKEEFTHLAAFHHDAGAGLGEPRRKRIAAHESDPHLVRAKFLGLREIVVAVLDQGRWPAIRRHRKFGLSPDRSLQGPPSSDLPMKQTHTKGG